jgi:hypothetical protein
MSTHFQGPLAGAISALGGVGADVPINGVSLQDWSLYFNDFHLVSDYDATNDWSLTQISGGGSAALVADAPNGTLRLDCPADNDGPVIQLDDGSIAYNPVAAVAGTNVASESVFAARFNLADVSASAAFIGLAELHATSAVLVAPETAATTSDTHAGFYTSDAASGVFVATAAGQTDTTAVTIPSAFTVADSTYVDVAVRVIGTSQAHFAYRPSGRNEAQRKVPGWVYLGGLTTADAWNANMFITIGTLGGGTGDDLDLDWVMLASKRDITIG